MTNLSNICKKLLKRIKKLENDRIILDYYAKHFGGNMLEVLKRGNN